MVKIVYGCEYRVLHVDVIIGVTCLLHLVKHDKSIGLEDQQLLYGRIVYRLVLFIVPCIE